MTKYVYLPIEFSHRELFSKSLIALRLLEMGCKVLIGQQWSMHSNIERLPKGVFLFKSYHKIYWPAMQRAKKFGHKVIALEEELFGTHTYEGIRPLVNEGLNNIVDVICLNSPIEKKVLEDASYFSLVESGNPRSDILRAEQRYIFDRQVKDIITQHGKFILINTNFGITNSLWGSTNKAINAAIQSGVLDTKSAESVHHFREAIRYEKYCTEKIMLFIDLITRQNKKVILRPHPNENLKKWQDQYESNKLVSVIREGSHIPWTLSAECLVHCGCTTGLEAALASVPVCSLTQPGNTYASSLVSNYVNPVVDDEQALAAFVLAGSTSRVFDLKASLNPSSLFYSIDGNQSAAKKIADCIYENLEDVDDSNDDLVYKAIPNVAQLKQKCYVDHKYFSELLDGLVANQEKLIEIKKLDTSVFQLEARSDIPNYLNMKVVPNLGLSDIYSDLKDAMLARDGGRFNQTVSLHRDKIRKSIECNRLIYKNSMMYGDLDNALFYLNEATNLAGIEMPLLYKDRANLHMAKKERHLAKLCIDRYHTLSASYESYLETKKFYSDRKLITIFGDSHTRFFRMIQKKYNLLGKLDIFLDANEFGGSTAYGLLNTESKSGFAAAFPKIMSSKKDSDLYIFHFGEIDCRRAGWVAARESGKTIEQVMHQSVDNYIQFLLSNFGGNLDKVIIFGPKPPLVDKDELEKILVYDQRSVAVTLSQRRDLTNLFNAEILRRSKSYGIRVLSIQENLMIKGCEPDFLHYGMLNCLPDDIHGNLSFFSDLYEKTLIKAGLYI